MRKEEYIEKVNTLIKNFGLEGTKEYLTKDFIGEGRGVLRFILECYLNKELWLIDTFFEEQINL